MTPETIGDATLYLGDCLNIIASLGRLDHVICDPPYEKEAHRKDRQVQRRDGLVAGALDFGQINEETRANVAFGCANHCDGWFIAFCQAEGVAPWRDSIEAAGAKYKTSMIWVKPDGMPQFNGQGPGMGYESLVAAWCGKGHSRWNGGGRHGVFIYPKGEGVKPQHQTQKPIRLMVEIVRLFTNEGDVVLDPFMGSGTTGVVCAKLGRKFIGIELEPKYFDIACERIQKAYDQPDMFIEPPKKAVQEGFDI